MSDVRELLDGIEKRAESATPGPWVADVNAVRPSPPAWECLALTYPTPHHRDNAQFIAHARTDVPRLVAALRAVLDLHRDIDGDGACASCANWDESECMYTPAGERSHKHLYMAPEVPVPCPTVRAITKALGGGA